jgi:hypothetical protein
MSVNGSDRYSATTCLATVPGSVDLGGGLGFSQALVVNSADSATQYGMNKRKRNVITCQTLQKSASEL